MPAETVLKVILAGILLVLVAAIARDWLREDSKRTVRWPRRLSVPVAVAGGIAMGAERTVLAGALLVVLAALHLLDHRLARHG